MVDDFRHVVAGLVRSALRPAIDGGDVLGPSAVGIFWAIASTLRLSVSLGG